MREMPLGLLRKIYTEIEKRMELQWDKSLGYGYSLVLRYYHMCCNYVSASARVKLLCLPVINALTTTIRLRMQ